MDAPARRFLALVVSVLLIAAAVIVARAFGGGPPDLTLVHAPGSAAPPRGRPSTAAATSASPPSSAAIGPIYVIVMENKESSEVLGNLDAPFLNRLAAEYAVATSYTGVAHPSQPNYLALFSGSTQGVTDDGVHTITDAQTLAGQIEAAGRTWHVAAENIPDGCFTGSTASGGPDGAGDYARKHNPAISFGQIAGDPAECSRIVDFAHFDADLGDFWLIVPNLCHDMHDCSIADGDAFLARFVPTILDASSFKSDGVLFLTFDEGTSDAGGGGTVATLAIGPGAAAETASDAAYDHYSLLRTVEDAWGLPCLANACEARSMADLLRH